ncbi:MULTISPECIES: hypothetical protein [Hyphomicrobiales]|uniref:Uncharacterized protein n=1 Tax=Agrobacterium pusense TaxID=648995 RepID=A0AA44EJQ6_9HYPH|nr:MULTISPECIES: hypothetical protein [Hyphomicrobiales]HED1836790.1 hypothetical protein [Citrobacter freundii]KAB2758298.1 hypothetical protein F9K98_22180 [Brucella anthropi]MCQ9147127.1 hypothetical protein [Ochrobactrum sp. BTU2]MDH2092407.1 hypothetical protein [Agrobacterium pusense]NRF09642.1 hypothetical protein [Agrobacterium pusense]
MPEDKHTGPEAIIPANGNTPPNGDIADADIAPWQRLDRVVFDIARLIGRQMAREDFERLRAATANDNVPRSAGDDEGGAKED